MPPPRLPPHLSHKSSIVLLPPASIAPPIEALRRQHDKQFDRWPSHINLIYPFLASSSVPLESGTRGEAIREQLESGQTPISDGVATECDRTRRLREEIRVRLQNVTRHFRPFKIVLSAQDDCYFMHGKRSATSWLKPLGGDVLNSDTSISISQQLIELQAALQAEFDECNADTRAFSPHLSVGQAAGRDSAEQLCEEARTKIDDFVAANQGAKQTSDATAREVQRPKRDSPENPEVQGLHWLVDRIFVIERKGYNDRFKVVGQVLLTGT